jgi:hypothetical protein
MGLRFLKKIITMNFNRDLMVLFHLEMKKSIYLFIISASLSVQLIYGQKLGKFEEKTSKS